MTGAIRLSTYAFKECTGTSLPLSYISLLGNTEVFFIFDSELCRFLMSLHPMKTPFKISLIANLFPVCNFSYF